MHQCTITANDLQHGDVFKLSPRHSKTYWVQKKTKLETPAGAKKPLPDEGKLLILTWNCKQLVFAPEHELFLVTREKGKEVSNG